MEKFYPKDTLNLDLKTSTTIPGYKKVGLKEQ